MSNYAVHSRSFPQLNAVCVIYSPVIIAQFSFPHMHNSQGYICLFLKVGGVLFKIGTNPLPSPYSKSDALDILRGAKLSLSLYFILPLLYRFFSVSNGVASIGSSLGTLLEYFSSRSLSDTSSPSGCVGATTTSCWSLYPK